MAKTLTKPAAKQLKPRRSPEEAPKVNRASEILARDIVMYDLSKMQPHPDNPNLGDVDSIVESIQENGVVDPILFNEGNGKIIAGHHTRLALLKLGHKTGPTIVINVSEKRHLKMMAALNETGRKAQYDYVKLNALLNKIGSTTGTGFTDMDAQEIRQRADEAARSASAAASAVLDDIAEEQRAADDAKSFDRSVLGEEPDPRDSLDDILDTTDEEPAGPSLEDATEELQGAFQLKPDMAFDGVGKWGLPRLRTDRLMTFDELPPNLEAWAGSATKDWPDPDQWWLYNFGIDSTSGMRDVSKVIISFYCYDQYFENWWHYPERYVGKLLNSNIKYAVMPDFSMHTPGEESRVISLWSLYRSRWLARYMQEAGIKVVPNVTWATKDMDFLTNLTLPTLPKNLPLLALQVQTVDDTSKEDIAAVQLILDTLKPKGLLLYHGKKGERVFKDGMVKYSGKVCYVRSRMARLAEAAKTKSKKKGI